MSAIYLDHTATTPLDPRVFEAMRPCLTDIFGNASSAHAFGRQAKQALEDARGSIARAVGAHPAEVFFTSGGTESDNTAIRGAALAGRKKGRTRVVTTAAEHHAVLDACEALKEEGYDVVILPVDSSGALRMEELRRAVDERCSLVSVMHANNEVGTLSPIEEIATIAHAAGALFHTDAVQTVGKIPLDVARAGIDLMTCTAHKLYGPKGIGVLSVRRGVELEPLLHGGGQERARRPGTENVAGAVGFAKAVELALSVREAEAERLRALRDALQKRLLDRFPGVIVNGDPVRRLPHILSISFGSDRWLLEGEMLVPALDVEGIAVSSGSACSSGSVQPSHVLLAMGRNAATAKATIRFSFGSGNREEDLERVIEAVELVVSRGVRHGTGGAGT